MNELVSIIMPSYNTGKYIAESINSVLKQTYKNWELIIVDDCSKDNTDEVVSLFLEDKRIKYIKNKENMGAAMSRNRAIREAKGKWIAFLDSDDLWMEEKLEKQIDFMKKNNYHFSYTTYEEINEASESIGVEISGPKKITKTGMLNFCWPGCLTVMYDADYVGEIQIADLKKNNDYAMWLMVAEKADCYFLNEILGSYRIRSGSISRHSKFKLIKHHYLLYKKGFDKSAFVSTVLTVNNLFYGVMKKILYKRRID